MKNIFISICTIMLFIPWTILILRTYDWALESPAAEVMILSYAAFMIFSGVFTIFACLKIDRGALMKILSDDSLFICYFRDSSHLSYCISFFITNK